MPKVTFSDVPKKSKKTKQIKFPKVFTMAKKSLREQQISKIRQSTQKKISKAKTKQRERQKKEERLKKTNPKSKQLKLFKD